MINPIASHIRNITQLDHPNSVIRYKLVRIPNTGSNENLYLNAATDNPNHIAQKTISKGLLTITSV